MNKIVNIRIIQSRSVMVGFFLFILIFFSINSFAQTKEDVRTDLPKKTFTNFITKSDTFNRKRFWTLNGAAFSTYVGTMVALNQAWYADFPRSSFHGFDDRGEWLDLDKYGHLYSAYLESQYIYKAYKWTGISDKKAVLMAAIWSTALQGTIEVFDGFSEEWGFSITDVAFNTAGTGLFVGQQLLWDEQRILVKYSANLQDYSDERFLSVSGNATSSEQERADEQFGTNIFERILKDYNGSTIWLSGNIPSFFPKKDIKIPKWLNVAFGVGAQNVLGAFNNTYSVDGEVFIPPGGENRFRQYYLSLDVDFTRIPTRSKFLKTIFIGLNAFKFPAPSFEFGSDGSTRFHAIYF